MLLMPKLIIDLQRPVRSVWLDRFVVLLLGISAGVAILVTAGIVLSLISSLSDDVINAVPQSLRDA